MANKDALLTIDFVGLCGFVANHREPSKATKVEVVMIDAADALPDDPITGKPAHELCRHDPVVVFTKGGKGERDAFSDGTPNVHNRSFTWPGGEDVGIWDIRNKNLRLEHIPNGFLEIDSTTYSQVLRLDQLTKTGQIDRANWLGTRSAHPARSARLAIANGELSGGQETKENWALGLIGEEPKGSGFQFRQVVTWKIFGDPKQNHGGARLVAGDADWVELRPGARILISNLCPLEPGKTTKATDVLALYELSTDPPPVDERGVLWRKGQPEAWVKPNSGACPPVTGYVVS